jgi:hypothetical protein
MQHVSLQLDRTPDPTRRQAVISGFHFRASVQMHQAFSLLAVAQGFEWQKKGVRFLFGEHARKSRVASLAGLASIRFLQNAAVIPLLRLPSSKRSLFLDRHPWFAQCATRAIRVSLVR